MKNAFMNITGSFSPLTVSVDELKGNGPVKVQTDIFWMHMRQNH